MRAYGTTIEGRHGFVSGSNLQLIEVSTIVVAFWAGRRRRVGMFPRIVATQDIVHLLAG